MELSKTKEYVKRYNKKYKQVHKEKLKISNREWQKNNQIAKLKKEKITEPSVIDKKGEKL